jgi:hypothetical protein
MLLYLFALLFFFPLQTTSQVQIAGLSLDELEMLEDFELRQLRDFTKGGKGSVSRAAKDEDINLFQEAIPTLPPGSDQNMVALVVGPVLLL